MEQVYTLLFSPPCLHSLLSAGDSRGGTTPAIGPGASLLIRPVTARVCGMLNPPPFSPLDAHSDPGARVGVH